MRFKKYEQNQGLCLPMYLDDLIPKDHVARVIDAFVDNLSMEMLEKPFKASKCNRGGNLPYHPKMMLKVVIYAYTQGIFSCRKIEKQLNENIIFIWLTGHQRPDFVTINRYRSKYLVDILPEILTELIIYLNSNDIVDLTDVIFIDGTKIKADANKNKVVWRKNVDRYKDKVNNRVNKMLEEIDGLDEEEMKRYNKDKLPKCEENKEYKSEELVEAAQKFEKALEVDGRCAKTESGKKLRKTKNKLKEDSKKLKKYEEQENDLAGKNSMSKTDKDAPVMMSKQGLLEPSYNPQVATNSEFIVGVVVSQNANDGTSLLPLLNNMQEMGLPIASRVVADAGYGHEENYKHFEDNKITAFVKYPSLHAELSNEKRYNFHKTRFKYDKENDIYICPMGKVLNFEEEKENTNKNGFKSKIRKYRCHECDNCSSREQCTKSQNGRTIQRNERLIKQQKEARARLESDEGKKLYKKRAHEVETVFGEIKRNLKFRHFHLRGLKKVSAEMNLLCLAFNLGKLARLGGAIFHFIIRLFSKIFALYDSQIAILERL